MAEEYENHYEQLKQGAPILNEDGSVYEFEDYLKWDNLHRRFYLKVEQVDSEFNISLSNARGSHENAVVLLKEISEIVYAYLYKKKSGIRREKLEYFLNFDLRNRRILYIAMLDMIRYALYGGGNIVGYQPGVNLNETDLGDIEKLRDERIVSYVTDSTLKTNRLIDRDFIERFSVPEDLDWSDKKWLETTQK